MKLSRWCHILHLGDMSALVNSLTLNVVYMRTDDLDILLQRSFSSFADTEETVQILIKQGLIVENDVADCAKLVEMRARLKLEQSLEMLYLLVTDGCNLRCVYCFEDAPLIKGKFRTKQMTGEIVKKSLDLFSSLSAIYGSSNKKKVIHLYGGEPLLNRGAVFTAINYADELRKRGALPKDCQIVVVTNGVLLDERDAQLFATNNVTVGLSIDGPASITDLYRIPKNSGVRVFERIIDSFRLLKKHGVAVGLSVTLTPDAVENFDDFLAFFIESEFRTADGLSLNLLHHTPRMELTDDYYCAAAECQIKAFEKFREVGFYEDRVMRKVNAFLNQEPMYADCGVVGRQLVVSPDGRIGVCQDFVKPRTYFSRSVFDSDHSDLLDTLFREWRDRSPFNMPQCLDCVAIGICGGGCPASAELKTGNRFNLDGRVCHHSKKTLEWLIWDVFTKMVF